MKKPTWGCKNRIIKALDLIGSHRKTRVYPHRTSCPISKRTCDVLVMYGWAMYLSDGSVMLTYEGERRWSQRHPCSKYRII